MFSQNGWISEKQMRRMVLLPLYASLIFVLPNLAAKQLGEHLLSGMLVFLGLAIGYELVLAMLVKWNEKWQRQGISKSIAIIWLVRIWIRIGFYLCLVLQVVAECERGLSSGDEMNWIIKMIPFLCICIYGAGLTLEQQGRLYEIAFWLLLVPFLFVIVFGIPHLDLEGLQMNSGASASALFSGVYPMLTFLLPMEYVLLLQSKVSREGVRKRTWLWIGATICLCGVITVFMLQLYGIKGAAKQELLAVEILRCIRLPFHLTERVDALLVWFFLVGCFVLLSESLFFARLLRKQILPNGKPVWEVLLLLGKGTVLLCLVKDYEKALALYCVFGMVVDVPLSILLPFINGWKECFKSWKKPMLAVGLWIGIALTLVGCGHPLGQSMQNVEEQDFATLLLLSKGEDTYQMVLGVARERKVGEESLVERFTTWEATDLEDLRRQYGLVMGKTLSLAHVKALLLPSVPEETLVEMIGQDRELAKTCPVLLWRGSDFTTQFLDFGQAAQYPVGIYFQNIMKKTKQQDVAIPWLLDYEKWVRGDGSVCPCYLKKVDKGYVILE